MVARLNAGLMARGELTWDEVISSVYVAGRPSVTS